MGAFEVQDCCMFYLKVFRLKFKVLSITLLGSMHLSR